MSHFLTIPIDDAGVLMQTQETVNNLDTLLQSPFDFTDVFFYSHGWQNTADVAALSYNRFSVEFAKRCLTSDPPSPACRMLGNSLAMGIHWPSDFSEDDNSLIDKVSFLSFYKMEKRADVVGSNGGYALLRTIIEQQPAGVPLAVHFIGHSFGCKVVCSALNELLSSYGTKEVAIPDTISFNLVLLQAAFDDDDLAPGNVYGDLHTVKNLRILATMSRLDLALMNLFPAAHAINIFGGPRGRKALGAEGPADSVGAAFGEAVTISIAPGYKGVGLPASRFICADITAIHQASGYQPPALAGHHSDIYLPEIYELISHFL